MGDASYGEQTEGNEMNFGPKETHGSNDQESILRGVTGSCAVSSVGFAVWGVLSPPRPVLGLVTKGPSPDSPAPGTPDSPSPVELRRVERPKKGTP